MWSQVNLTCADPQDITLEARRPDRLHSISFSHWLGSPWGRNYSPGKTGLPAQSNRMGGGSCEPAISGQVRVPGALAGGVCMGPAAPTTYI